VKIFQRKLSFRDGGTLWELRRLAYGKRPITIGTHTKNYGKLVDLPNLKMLMIHSYVLPLPELPAKDLKAAHQSF